MSTTKPFLFNILYIEDEVSVRKVISSILKNFCTNLIVATDGADGLEKFQINHIDLIITDLNMPHINGMSMIKKIREINGHVPIIIISAHNDSKTLHESINNNIQGYIFKPINIKKLLEKITEVKNNIQNSPYQLINVILPQKKLNKVFKPLEESIVVLIKIEEFKYLNNSITNKISEKLQFIFAKELLKYIPSQCNFSKIYLLDNGEFVFTKKYNSIVECENLQSIIQEFQQYINSEKIKIGLVDYTLSIRISLAYGKDALRNAQFGMRELHRTQQEFIVANSLIEKEKEKAIKKLQTFQMLKTAIDAYNIVSYFQPIINNKTKEIEKYESLVRLIDEENNVIAPHLFLETAKEGKYYQKITHIVLQNSFKALSKTDKSISINLSALDIEKSEITEEFLFLLKKYKSEASRVVVELLEDESIKNTQVIHSFLQEIKHYGVKIAIDDFGVGLSNFSRVLKYQPNYIKIDGSIIKNIEHNSFSRNMVESIVDFSKKEKIQTIAEYVENEAIYHILCEIGVDYSQGYYFGKAERLV